MASKSSGSSGGRAHFTNTPEGRSARARFVANQAKEITARTQISVGQEVALSSNRHAFHRVLKVNANSVRLDFGTGAHTVSNHDLIGGQVQRGR